MPSLNKDELVGLTTSLQGLTTRLRATGRLDYETLAGREVALQSAAELDRVATSFSSSASTARQNGNHHLAPALSRVASSFERMNSGITTMVNAHKTMSTAGKFTAAGGFSYATGALSLMAGAASLIGSDGPDYSGPLSEIHAEINALRHELREEFRMVGQVLQNEIRVVGQMVAQVMVNQQIILNAVHQALNGIDQVKTLLAEHVQTTGATLTHIATKDLREARDIVERYRAGALITSSDPGADNIVLAEALNKLQRWFETELKTPVINEAQLQSVTSEHMVRILSQQSPLNSIGLIAARLRFLFGDDILDKKFTTLPPLEVYQSTVALFLLGVQKSQLFSQDACQSVCQNIQDTLQLYLEFIDCLKSKTQLWEALLPDYHRDEVRLLLNIIADLTESKPLKQLKDRVNLLTTQSIAIIPHPSVSHYQQSADYLYLRMQKEANEKIFKARSIDHYVPYPDESVDEFKSICAMRNIDLAVKYPRAVMESDGNGYYGELMHVNHSMYILLVAKGIERGYGGYWHDGKCLSLDSVRSSVLLFMSSYPLHAHNLQATFEYYSLVREGNIHAAKHFLNRVSEPFFDAGFNGYRTRRVDHFCLLYLIAILGRWDIFENFIKSSPLPSNFNYSTTLPFREKCPQLTLLMIAAQHGREDVVEGLLLNMNAEDVLSRTFDYEVAATLAREQGQPTLAATIKMVCIGMLGSSPAMVSSVKSILSKMTSADIARFSESKTAAQLALAQGFYNIAYRLRAGLTAAELIQVRASLPQDVLLPITSAAKSLAVSLGQMITEVNRFETEFKIQYKAKRLRSATVVVPVSAARAEETDDEAEEVLEEVTAEFCADQGIARVNASFWSKAIDPEQHKTGQRIIPTSFFQNKRQELKFKAALREYDFLPTPDVIDNADCLVAVMKRPVRH